MNIILLLIFVLVIIIVCKNKENYENSDVCQNCFDMSLEECAKCSDCGICYKNGIGKCVRGNETQPLFYDTCDKWEYMGKEPDNECYLYNDIYSQNNCGGYYSYPQRSGLYKKYGKKYDIPNYKNILEKMKLKLKKNSKKHSKNKSKK